MAEFNLSIEEILKKIITIDANNNVQMINNNPQHVGGMSYGYVRLDSNGRISLIELGGTGASATKFLRGDQTWAAPPGGGVAKETHIPFLALDTEVTF